MAEFLQALEEAVWVRADATGQYYLLRAPGGPWRLYQRGIEAAFLLAEGEKALLWAPEFGVLLPDHA
ncbi:hypothetical protein TCCBUS3UF1_p120 (plasmid) [Thermus sp. CCB_US3_UF1]|uniref:hypothetical protein n=1 Tax=unclassified Thermus TaxID=2619321 RepID=UPI00023893F9|nr:MULTISPECIES: hypothetical protein [unclassified Thermus]AEV17309.1 hypothetical protein TCCBUS3UF1_p120 [Thermus sp. CCB_US3_UF1]MCS6868161.1 hypothetical protein [Thermus sp.]MDW8358780.1 hypothetical protein [Thermus sp.]